MRQPRPRVQFADGGCEWFLLCTNPAVGEVAHPVLGNVPTCQRCADKLGLDLKVRVVAHD